jgi:spore coat protein SA
MIYHVLPEAEPFSEYYGGALSRWTANVLRRDKNCTIVCPWADDTWGFASHQVWRLRGLRNYAWLSKIPPYRSALALRLILLKLLFAPFMKKVMSGDTLYVHNRPEFALALRSMCRRKGAHIVLHMQNSHLLRLPIHYQVSLDVDLLVFCSTFLKTEASKSIGRARAAAVIPNGADDAIFFPKGENRSNEDRVPIILFASRLIEEKGPHIFLDAMRLLGERRTPAKGIIVGSSNFGRSKPTAFVRELRRLAPGNVEFHDYCSGKALADIFRNADIFCLPSVFNDPFPLAVLEAMASRLAVVATHSGGIPEALTEGGGLLVQRGSASDLAVALEHLISEPSLREKMADDGYASFRRNFTWATVQEHYRKTLRSLSI